MRESASKESVAVEEVVGRLELSFPGIEPAVVADIVHAEHHVFDGRPVRDYVPVLVERQARQRLRERLAAV